MSHAVHFHETTGGPEVLRLEDIPASVPTLRSR